MVLAPIITDRQSRLLHKIAPFIQDACRSDPGDYDPFMALAVQRAFDSATRYAWGTVRSMMGHYPFYYQIQGIKRRVTRLAYA